MLKVEIPRVECEKLEPTYGKFVIEPLERGYGHTLGSSIAKIMYPSISGIAPKWVNIEGAVNQYSSVPYISEDITEVIQNIKKMVVRTERKETFFIHTEVEGPGEIKAGDFSPYMDIEMDILNPDLRIATVKNFDKRFNIEICLSRGNGYCPAEEQKDTPEGYIPLDSLYSPIRKVDYTVVDTRVGQITDYDKLIIEIYTNGVISPEEALDMASTRLQEYLQSFIDLSDDTFEGIMKPVIPKVEDEVLNKDIEDLNLSVRSFNCLRRYGIETVGDLVQKTEEEIMNLRNFGKKSLEEIKLKLVEYELSLKKSDD